MVNDMLALRVKIMLDAKHNRAYGVGMNKLPLQKRAQILQMLAEGNSLRATGRMADVAYNTVLKLVRQAGEACAAYQDKHLTSLSCKKIQVDEIWSFVGCKQKNLTEEKQGFAGDVWVWVAIDADTKLVPSYFLGNRDLAHAKLFMKDLATRLMFRVQLTSDGLGTYKQAVEEAFGDNVDFAQMVKIYGDAVLGPDRRYSSENCIGTKKIVVSGNPDMCCVSTSFVERQNLTMRMQSRRFTRLTNAFSKKIENHYYALALHFMAYNFTRIHQSLRVTPAMAAGVAEHVWTYEEIAALMD